MMCRSVELLKGLALRLLNNTQKRLSLDFFGEECPVLPLRVRPAAEIHSLSKVQMLQLLVGTAGLLQKPANYVGRVYPVPASLLANV
jgi:hypothetical protein